MFYEDFLTHDQLKTYTFGQPRVGNKDFEDAVTHNIDAAYRVVHRKDLVVHVPPCIIKLGKHNSYCNSHGILPFYAFHTIPEVFYPDTSEEGNNVFEVCYDHESSNCSNRQKIFLSVDDHTHYMGLWVGAAYLTERDD